MVISPLAKFMKSHIDKIIAATLLFALLSAVPSGSGAQQSRIKGRALLVGVSQYQQHPAVRPTRGAEDDARETAQFIQAQYGFRPEEIHTLIGPQATAANIKAEFRHWLIEGTQAGDRVFFLYAGHGSQMKDTSGDEADGYDEVLAPYDVNWRGDSFVNVISDDELGKLIGQLSGRLAVLVFDSCNSGTISRGSPGTNSKAATGDARYLPSPEEAAKLGIGLTTRGGAAVDYFVEDERLLRPKSGSPAKQQERDLNVVDIGAQDAATGIVVISAAQSTQTAFSMDTGGGKYRGALSYVFSEEQRGRQPKLSELRLGIERRIAEFQRTGRLRGEQKPAIEILATIPLEDKPLFGGRLSLPEVAFANPQSALRVTLRSLEGKQVYKLGDDISYEVTTNAPGWLYLLVFSQQQVATCIFPNNHEPDSKLSKGTHRLPAHDFFQAQEPVGKDVVIALLSSVPLNLGDKEDMTWQKVFDRLRSKKLAGYVQSRGVGTKKTAPGASLDEADWQAASLVIETVH